MFALGGVCVCGSRSVVVCALPSLPLPYTCPTTPTADVAAAVTTLHTSCLALAPTLGHVPYWTCPLAGPSFVCAHLALISVCSTLPVKA